MLDEQKDSHPDLLKYMLYYDLMVKLAVTDTASLFNLTAEVVRKDRDAEMMAELAEKNPDIDTNKNIHETLVDTYLLHFLREMDPKLTMKSEIFKKLMDKNAATPDIENMGKLESMRKVMKLRVPPDAAKTSEKLHMHLGNMIKRRIADKKKAAGNDTEVIPQAGEGKEHILEYIDINL